MGAFGEVQVMDWGLAKLVQTGAPPFRSADSAEAHRRAMQGDLADAFARLERCGADAELIALAKACLAPWPDARPRDAGLEVLRGVERVGYNVWERRPKVPKWRKAMLLAGALGRRVARLFV